MTDRASHQAQREALKEVRRSPSTRQELHESALDKYLRMQDVRRRRAEAGGSFFSRRSGRKRRNGETWHDHVNVDGREVEVSGDELGITELHES
jgi:hypothetical protein